MDHCQLYLITPPAFEITTFSETLKRALEAAAAEDVAVACLQIRLKDVPDTEVLAAAEALKPILSAHKVAMLINDRADLAKAAKADGVHLGQSDGSVRDARSLLGEDADIGVTCHDSRHLAMLAAEQGADYVAFGAFYPTTTKQTEYRPDPEILAIWSEMTMVPCVAIGGITPSNAGPLVAAGADYLAVSSGVFAHPEGPAVAMAEFARSLHVG